MGFPNNWIFIIQVLQTQVFNINTHSSDNLLNQLMVNRKIINFVKLYRAALFPREQILSRLYNEKHEYEKVNLINLQLIFRIMACLTQESTYNLICMLSI